MNKQQFASIEQYMLSCMEDSAHDREHVYRVLHTALQLAVKENEADLDVLVCACILHDIGRKEQFADPRLCHAMVGGEKAERFLLEQGFEPAFAAKVRYCIETHRFRKNTPPETLEAKILFDADKLDASGAMGIARTLLYTGQVSAPLYSRNEKGEIMDGTGELVPSFFREYKFKLEKLYDRFYTQKGRELALERKKAAADFYEAMLREVRESHAAGAAILKSMFTE